MPGILPMKMIRVGGTSQARIAQACDRCRSKKIRCDGVRPCCTQCANVGFECKTSDKLSRRAFPRGYTESLEDRVRALESEVRDLKDLLDEKDEKIDMLSRIHNFSPASRKGSSSLSPQSVAQLKAEIASSPEEVLHVELPAPVEPTSTFTGTSTTSALFDCFEENARERGRPCSAVSSSVLLTPSSASARPTMASPNTSIAPPRLLSDQYINLYFQEWQPLLPVLHRPTFLRIYEQFSSDPEARCFSSNKTAAAQLFLVFEIAAHSSSSKTKPNTTIYELQWRKALGALSSVPSVEAMQCHVLAQLAYLLKGDYSRLLRHRAYSVSICHQLGLHQGHRCHSLAPMEAETRKKVFWCQYVIDKFASATTGMPTLLRDSDITTEYPADVDDENISAQGFSPALPGELTKMSAALALFRASRILAKTLEHLYPAKVSYQLSLSKLHSLSDELDLWHEELPGHLRLRFCNDKPATNMTSDRSPILCLAYFYTRSLIHRPILCYGSGSAASASTIVLAAAAKHIVQVVDLLEERCMNYTFPINRQDLLVNSGVSILWQCLDLEGDSKLVKDNQKSLSLLLDKIMRENRLAGTGFRQVVSSFVSIGSPRTTPPVRIEVDTPAAHLLNSMPAPPPSTKSKSARKQLQAIASRFSNVSSSRSKPDDGPRRSRAPQTGLPSGDSPHYGRNDSTVSLASTRSAPVMSSNTVSPIMTSSAINLDYFILNNPRDGNGNNIGTGSNNSSTTMLPPRNQLHHSGHVAWEHLVGDLNLEHTGPLPDMCGTVSPHALTKTISNSEDPSTSLDWSDHLDLWQMNSLDLGSRPHVPQSLLSFSEESMASGEDLLFSAAGSHNGSISTTNTSHEGIEHGNEETYKGITMPVSTVDEVEY